MRFWQSDVFEPPKDVERPAVTMKQMEIISIERKIIELPKLKPIAKILKK